MLARFAFPQLAPDWVLEVTIYVFIWVALLSGSSLIGRSIHVRADLIYRLFSRRGKRFAEITNILVSVAFCAVLFVSGLEVLEFAIDMDERSASSLRFPIALYYAALPTAMGLMVIRYLVRLWQVVVHGLPEDDEPSEHGPKATALN